MKSNAIAFAIICVAVAASMTPLNAQPSRLKTGFYSDDLIVVVNQKTGAISGLLESYRVAKAEPDVRTRAHCCWLYFKGRRVGSVYSIKCYDSAGRSQVINVGSLRVISDSVISINLGKEPDGCTGMTNGSLAKGKLFRYVRTAKWMGLGMVKSNLAAMFSKPDPSFASTLQSLHNGDVVRIIATKGGFSEVEYRDGIAGTTVNGWVRKSDLVR